MSRKKKLKTTMPSIEVLIITTIINFFFPPPTLELLLPETQPFEAHDDRDFRRFLYSHQYRLEEEEQTRLAFRLASNARGGEVEEENTTIQ